MQVLQVTGDTGTDAWVVLIAVRLTQSNRNSLLVKRVLRTSVLLIIRRLSRGSCSHQSLSSPEKTCARRG
jgi:hypothetical protein